MSHAGGVKKEKNTKKRRGLVFSISSFLSFRRPTHARIESASLAPTAAVKRTTGTPSPGSCGGGPASTSAGRCNVSVLAVDGALHDAPSRTDAMHCNMPRLRSLRRVYFLSFSHCGGFLSGCGDGDFLRRGKCLFRVLSLGVAVLVEGQLSNERSRGFGSFRVPLCRRTRRVVSPRVLFCRSSSFSENFRQL